MNYILLSVVLTFSQFAFAQLPKCQEYGTNSSEVAFDQKSNQIVFFDQSTLEKSKFQVWNLKTKKLVKAGSLAGQSNYILGFNDSNTIMFSGMYDSSGFLTFGPIQRYNIKRGTVTEAAVERAGLSLTAYNVKAGIAIAKSDRGSDYVVDLKTGKLSFAYYDIQNGDNGFSSDGSNFYSLLIPAFWTDTKSEISILNFSSPKFFGSEPKFTASINAGDVGMTLGANAQIHSSAKAVSETGKSLVIALEIYSDTGSGTNKYRKIMWLDTVSGQKTFCDLEFSRGRSQLQIIDQDEKLVLFQSDVYPDYHFRTLLNMTTCQSHLLPNMEGDVVGSPGYFISVDGQRLYYSRGGVWDLDTGKTVLRTCE